MAQKQKHIFGRELAVPLWEKKKGSQNDVSGQGGPQRDPKLERIMYS